MVFLPRKLKPNLTTPCNHDVPVDVDVSSDVPPDVPVSAFLTKVTNHFYNF